MAILDEPPFCWLAADGRATGCDVEVATVALHRAGVAGIEFVQVDFAALLPGVLAGRWHLTTGLFITPARQAVVRFSRPIWTVPDGLIVRRERPLKSYVDIAADPSARLAVVTGQVQGDSARAAGVPEERIVRFDTQEETVRAVLRGAAEAAASTAIGNRAILDRFGPELTVVDLPAGADGGFAVAPDLADALDAALDGYLGSAEHRAVMTRYGVPVAAPTDRRG
jgi:polar amino acid transport system substrate-binding protein